MGTQLPTAYDHLRSMLEHHIWASLALIDRCEKLTPDQLLLTSPGTYGAIGATLDHLVRADRRYQARILGEPRMRPAMAPDLAVLHSEMESQATRWREFLSNVDELDAVVAAEVGGEPYPEIKHAVGLLLTQAVHHGNDHRTHVCTILGAHHIAYPDMDVWSFGEATGKLVELGKA